MFILFSFIVFDFVFPQKNLSFSYYFARDFYSPIVFYNYCTVWCLFLTSVSIFCHHCLKILTFRSTNYSQLSANSIVPDVLSNLVLSSSFQNWTGTAVQRLQLPNVNSQRDAALQRHKEVVPMNMCKKKMSLLWICMPSYRTYFKDSKSKF